ncbi:MAG: formylglycine-generating enzyme family protein [Bacteroidales bacterium]|nr:formylglycine-generating enzyme family protein [Bacteroidales bacterium]
MKKSLVYGMGLLLCLMFGLFTGCEEKEKEEPNKEPKLDSYTETALGMALSMVGVQGGSFEMGATPEQEDEATAHEKPVHKVTLSSFYIGQYEVTQAQWLAVMGRTMEQQLDTANNNLPPNGGLGHLYGVGSDYPIYYVSWDEVHEFCERLSAATGKVYRLPTEAEWEYAARGGQKKDGTKYAGSNMVDSVAWYGEMHTSSSHPVGQKWPNGLGIYDMSGNVAEWCLDNYGNRYYDVSPEYNPQGPKNGNGRVVRGGGWLYQPAYCCRVSFRSNSMQRYGDRLVGFRVVCEQ